MDSSIYEYTDPGAYLRDHFHKKKKINSSFSIRIWAQRLGLKGHSLLSEVIHGKRKIPTTLVLPLSEYLKLRGIEKSYFEAIVEYSRAQDKKHKSYAEEKLNKIKNRHEKKLKRTVVDDFSPFEDPLSFFVLEAASLFQIPSAGTVDFLFHVFNGKFPKFKIKRLVNLLVEKNFLSQGKYLRRNFAYIYSQSDELNHSLQSYHRNLLILAEHALKELPLNSREFNGVSINVSKNKIQEIKSYLRNCLDEYIKKFESPCDEGDYVTQLNMQWFTVGEKYH